MRRMQQKIHNPKKKNASTFRNKLLILRKYCRKTRGTRERAVRSRDNSETSNRKTNIPPGRNHPRGSLASANSPPVRSASPICHTRVRPASDGVHVTTPTSTTGTPGLTSVGFGDTKTSVTVPDAACRYLCQGDKNMQAMSKGRQENERCQERMCLRRVRLTKASGEIHACMIRKFALKKRSSKNKMKNNNKKSGEKNSALLSQSVRHKCFESSLLRFS
jgi:hypothetical protein